MARAGERLVPDRAWRGAAACLPALALLAALCACTPLGAASSAKAAFTAVLFVRAPEEPGVHAAALARELPADAADGSEARPFATVGEAVRAAPSGALIRIGEGVFHEKLSLSRPVVLVGKGPSLTRFAVPEGDGREPGVLIRGSDHVELRNLAVEGGVTSVLAVGGLALRLENVALRGARSAALILRGGSLSVVGSEIIDVGLGRVGSGVQAEGASLELRSVALRAAGRRAIEIKGGQATLVDVDAAGSALTALQVVDGALVSVLRGRFEGFGGAALYAGGARLDVQGAAIARNEYGAMAFRDAELNVRDCELVDHHFAAVALVGSRGSIERTHIVRGGTEAAIALSDTHGNIAINDNTLVEPGRMGVHVTRAIVSLRGNIITGASHDLEGDMGDGLYGLDATVTLDQNIFRGNAGSGVALTRCEGTVSGNDLVANGRAGLLLLEGSRATATGNLFQRNASGVELAERSRVSLARNRFGENGHLDIDLPCSSGAVAELRSGNTFSPRLHERACP